MKMTDKKFELTRRRVLAGLTTAGFASAAAGLGTSAYFNDSESFDNNSLTAGELNLGVSVDLRNKSAELPDPIIESDTGPNDSADGNVVTITVNDLKPGDWFILEWDPEVYSNPGYVQVTSVDEDYSNDEGDNPESETDTGSPGDLGDALLTTVWGDFVSSGGTGDLRGDLEGLDPTTDLNDTGLGTYETSDLDGATGSGAHYTTMNEAHDVYKTGVTLRDPGTGDPLEVGHGGNAATFYQLFELPPGVGNDVQGDSVTFTLRFDTEQARHNDTPFNSS
jgi:predicted ribosomally synthesized peptide with SipW-like signal peptide